MVDNLQNVFQRAVDRYLDQLTSSDEDIAVEFQETSRDSKTQSSAGSQTGSKRKKNESTPCQKRKSIGNAQTNEKPTRERTPEKKNDGVKNNKKVKGKTKVNAKKGRKMKKKNSDSPSPVRRTPSPSWPPSTPEPDFESEDEAVKTKTKHKHWKEVFKDKKNNKKEEEPKQEEVKPVPKEKNVKLRETIEKLKAKNDLVVGEDKFLAIKVVKKDKPIYEKEKNNTKKGKTKKCEFDFEDDCSTKDSIASDDKKKKSSMITKKSANKKVQNIDGLNDATEQTLKVIIVNLLNKARQD